jgi:hypothetical protein
MINIKKERGVAAPKFLRKRSKTQRENTLFSQHCAASLNFYNALFFDIEEMKAEQKKQTLLLSKIAYDKSGKGGVND